MKAASSKGLPSLSAFSFAFFASFAGSPRWLISVRLFTPWSRMYLMVGSAAIIRVSS